MIRNVFLACTIVLLIHTIIGCAAGQDPEPALDERLQVHIARTFEAHDTASQLWGSILEGETVSCTATFDRPPLFLTTEDEIAHETLSIPVQEHLNDAILELQALHALWETECASVSTAIALSRTAQALDHLKRAETALIAAAAAWHVWQS